MDKVCRKRMINFSLEISLMYSSSAQAAHITDLFSKLWLNALAAGGRD